MLLCPGMRCSRRIFFMCSTLYTQFVVLQVFEVLGSIKCCTAPFALGRKQALGFTSLSVQLQHHALSWQKGSSFEHKASSICPCETSYLCYILLLQFANFIIVQWKEISPFHHPMHAMQAREKITIMTKKKTLTNPHMFTLCEP